MKKFALLFVLWSLAATLLTACGGSAGSCVSGSSGGSTPTVHMCGNNFVQTRITISKGQNFPLVDDASSTHIIANGNWGNGSAQPQQESGRPGGNKPQFNS